MTDLDRVRPWLEAALRYSGDTHEWEDVVQGLIDGRMQLWAGDKSAAVTEILVYPRKKVLHVFLAGGTMSQLIDMIDDVAQWGKTQGCTGMTLSGRNGWKRILSKLGWDAKMVVMEKEI